MWQRHPCGRRRPAARGFTLIELLVVVAVIGILAALVMPSIVLSMKSATAAHCKSNLRQTAAGFVLYLKQYQGFMAPSGSPSSSPPYRYPYWYRNLQPFVTDTEIFRCPSKKRAAYGYGLNHMWSGPSQIYGNGTAMWNISKEIEQVRNPSGTIIICDTAVVTNKDDPAEEWVESDASNTNGCCRFPYDNKPGEPGNYTCWVTDPRRPVPRHRAGKTNCLFFDSHIKGIETADIIDDLWDEPGCIYDNDGNPKRKY